MILNTVIDEEESEGRNSVFLLHLNNIYHVFSIYVRTYVLYVVCSYYYYYTMMMIK